MLLVLIVSSSDAIIKISVVLFKHPFLSHPHRFSLDLPVACVINCPCPCNCFLLCFILNFFLRIHLVFLYLHLVLFYMEQLTIFLCCFLHTFVSPKFPSPQSLGLQSILYCLYFLIDIIGLYLSFSCQFSLVEFLATLRMLENITPLILPRCE